MSVSDQAVAVRLRRVPGAWRPGRTADEFVAVEMPAGSEHAVVSVLPSEAENPDYLLDRHRSRIVGPLGRPIVQSLPDLIADGVSIVSFEESGDGGLHVRIDLVRRAWNLDIAVCAHGVAIENAAALFSDMLDLLWEVRPEGNP